MTNEMIEAYERKLNALNEQIESAWNNAIMAEKRGDSAATHGFCDKWNELHGEMRGMINAAEIFGLKLLFNVDGMYIVKIANN